MKKNTSLPSVALAMSTLALVGTCGSLQAADVRSLASTSRQIRGRLVTTYIHSGGETVVPVASAHQRVRIQQQNPDGSWSVVPCVATGVEGEFVSATPVSGPYWLERTGNYYRLNQDVVNLSDARGGRPNLVVANLPTSLRVHMDGLGPVTEMDYVALVTPNHGGFVSYYTCFPEQFQGDWTPGMTTLEGTFAMQGMPLVDGRQGDRAIALSMVERPIRPFPTAIFASKAVSLPAFSTPDGSTSEALGTFLPEPVRRVDYYAAAPEFFALAASQEPRAKAQSFYATWSPEYLASQGQSGGPLDELFWGSLSGQLVTDIHMTGFPLVNPFARMPGVQLLVRAQQTFTTEYLAYGASSPSRLTGHVHVATNKALSSVDPLRPKAVPVRDVFVNEQPLTQPLEAVGLTPTIAWRAGNGPEATEYRVYVREVCTVQNRTSFRTVATFHTREEGLQVPAGLLLPGREYMLEIRTVLEDGVTTLLDLPRNRANVSSASRHTFTFRTTRKPCPTIQFFGTNPLQPSEGTVLSWRVMDADQVVLTPGNIPLDPTTGTILVKPTVSTTYMLTATNATGTRTQTFHVSLGKEGPVAGSMGEAEPADDLVPRR